MPPEPPPVPDAACFWLIPAGVLVHFDQPLLPGDTWNVANWFVRWNNQEWPVTKVTTLGAQVALDLGLAFLNLGADVVSYSPPPFDVTGLHDNPVEAFADYPLVPCV